MFVGILMAVAALIALIIFISLVVFYQAFSWGYVLFKFWFWFLLPVFVTLPSITFYQAVGLMLFIGLFKNHVTTKKIKKEYMDQENKTSDQVIPFLLPWLVLGIGYLVKLIIL